MTNLPTLIEKVKALTGADREVDAQIWLATEPGATRSELRYTHKASGKECVIDETRDASRCLIIVPAYTASVDAAMTLVPEGWGFMLAAHDDGGHAYAAGCFPHQGDAEDCGAISPTPALALAIAALQARIGGEG